MNDYVISYFLKSCKYNVNSIITPFPKMFVVAMLGSTETESIGIHDVHLFIEFAMHYRAIFEYSCFRLFCEPRETLLPCFGPYF